MRLLIGNSAHVLEDLLPYVCIVHDCPRSTTPFDSRTLWLNHLKAKHESNLAKSGLACTLCAEIITGDHRARVAHVERHLIEIALSVLPAGEDHDTENLPPRTSNSPPTIPNVEVENDAGLIFITGGTPAEFASKKSMTDVRKKAMAAFLASSERKTKSQSKTSKALARNLSSAHSTSHDGTFESIEDPVLRAENRKKLPDR
jgi:hypothetical protein